LKFGLLCSCLTDSPPVGRERSTWSQLAGCSSCSSFVLERLPFDPIFQSSSAAGGLADGPPGVRGQSPWSVLWTDGPRCLHGRSVIVGAVLEVCKSFSDSPPLPRRRSAVGSRTVLPELADSDEGTNYITRTSTPAAPEAPRTSTPAAPEAPQAPSTPLGAPSAQTSFPPPGPITRARVRELNYIMLLKNEGPEA
jgi:hypothetical protein